MWSHLQAQGVNILEFAKTDKRTQQVLDYIRRERDKLTPELPCSTFGDAHQFCRAFVLSNEDLATCTDQPSAALGRGSRRLTRRPGPHEAARFVATRRAAILFAQKR